MSCLPDLPKPGEYGALVVIVTILRHDSRKKLEDLLESESLGQKFAFVYCYDNLFQRRLEELGGQGSIGQIYNIATNAYTLAWKRLIIVDALSREQLTGHVRPGRSTDVSVVYVQLDGTKGDGIDSMPCEVNIIAKRMYIDRARQAIREQKRVLNEIPRDNGSLDGTLQEWFEAGMLLYDPLKPIYDKTLSSSLTTDEVGRAIEQVLSLRTCFPSEVAAMIKQYAREERDLEKLISAPSKFEIDPKRLEVHLLKPLKATEFQSLQAMYNRKLQDSHKDVKLLPMPTRRASIETAAEVWETVYSSDYPQDDYSKDYAGPAFEILLDPCAKYFYDPPPFVSLMKDAITAPVFFLTRHLTAEETSAIKAELHKPNGEDEEFEHKDLAFIEWKADADEATGVLDRQFLSTGRQHRITRSDEDADQDTESVVDDVYGSWIGVQHGRCEPKEAAGVRARLDLRTMEFTDFVGTEIDERHEYFRPDLEQIYASSML
ncbi:MAG: hypothetical protein Q9181_004821 [Wetmoreana brouardii]